MNKHSVQDLLNARLRNQLLHRPAHLQGAADVVAWLGAVQAQDYGAAKWALAVRLGAGDDAAVEQAFASGEFVRTHVLRPTWHFVMPADLRWMQRLTGARVRTRIGTELRKRGITDALVLRGMDVVGAALRGAPATREELGDTLAQAGVDLRLERLGLVLLVAELEALVCSGPPRGKAQTYALVAERAPASRELGRDAALAELAGRYFRSHGPATVHDFAWWSGLTVADAQRAVELQPRPLESLQVTGRQFWSSPGTADATELPRALLLPNFDEYVVAYEDRSDLARDVPAGKLDGRGNVLFNHVVVVDGAVAGTWTRVARAREVVLDVVLFKPPTKPLLRQVTEAAQRYAAGVGKTAVVRVA